MSSLFLQMYLSTSVISVRSRPLGLFVINGGRAVGPEALHKASAQFQFLPTVTLQCNGDKTSENPLQEYVPNSWIQQNAYDKLCRLAEHGGSSGNASFCCGGPRFHSRVVRLAWLRFLWCCYCPHWSVGTIPQVGLSPLTMHYSLIGFTSCMARLQTASLN